MRVEPPPIEALTRRAEKELAEGRPWEARYLLASRIGRELFNPDLYEVYGRILLRIGSTPGAGLWLFLSGRRQPEYEQAIARFIGRRTGRLLYAVFPPHARLGSVDKYPEPLRAELKALGVPDDPGVPEPPPVPDRATHVWASVFLAVGCGGSLLFGLVSLVVGVAVVGDWLAKTFGR